MGSTEMNDMNAACAPDGVDNSRHLHLLAAALSNAQGLMSGALKDSNNLFFKSKYSDLHACWEACRKPLSDNKIAIVQTPEISESYVSIVTLMVHESGQWMRSRISMVPKDFSPQSVGSVMTYARRYALASMVGLSQVDDDAESAQPRGEDTSAKNDKKAREYAKRFQDSLDIGLDQAIVDIHLEVVEDEEFYRKMWAYIPAPARRAIKEIIARSKPEPGANG